MNKTEKLNLIRETGVIAIMRAQSPDQLTAAADAIKKGGVRVIEVTMTTPGALNVIAEATQRYGQEVLFGAGTVLDPETARSAILAGAGFIVAPTLNLDVIALCNRYGIPVMPGCFTPTEMLTAWEAGADMIKLFPAERRRAGIDQGAAGAAAAVADRAGRRRGFEHGCRIHPERGGCPGRGQQPDQPEAAGRRGYG